MHGVAKVDLYNCKGERIGELKVSIFDGKVNEDAIKLAIAMYVANRRSGTSSTKRRSEVRGGGRKPWRQKGTGRARAGSIRSPLWRGGGKCFGPKPRDYSYSLPKKVKGLALRSALILKAREGRLRVLDELRMNQPKTKVASELLKALKVKGTSLLVVPGRDEPLKRACRNLAGLRLSSPSTLNAYEVLRNDWLVITKEGLLFIEERLTHGSL